MKEFDSKMMNFVCTLLNVYKEEENRDEISKLELKEETLTEDFTAMIYAQFMLYKEITGDDTDIIGFTHILNRLIFQHLLKEKEEEEDE